MPLALNQSFGYTLAMSIITEAASIMGRKSVKVRRQKWGEQEFIRRMRVWGKLGGRPRKAKPGAVRKRK